jgi:NAD(P)-dependent dehydrogenase (short-subunit alcohol dehydrogenase family)
MKLRGRVAIVTGAGRGIGKAIAFALAQEGAYLVLTSRTSPEVEATTAEVRHHTRRALAIQMDVSQRQEVEAMVASTLAGFGRIDILVNNAGVQPPIGPLWENDPDQWLQTILINLGGVFLCCRAVIPVMIRQGGGKVINLSGGGATSPRPYFSAYAASKSAVVRLTETLAEELKPSNIQVNAIAPGAVYTKMTEDVLAADSAAGEQALTLARRVKEERMTHDGAAELAVFLASDESDGLTGRLISAIWDDWRSLPLHLGEVMASELYTLRRVTADSGPGGRI